MSVGRKHRHAVLEPLGRLFRTGSSVGLSDGQLLDRFANRHDEAAEAAFAALVDRHGPMVLSVCRRVLHDPNDAQDAFQATFLVLVRKAGSVRNSDSLASWLYGVARRVSVHSRASAIRRRQVESNAAPSTEYQTETTDRELWDEVDRLPESLRSAVVLCYLEGHTHEQASSRLGWPVGTVRSRLARARERLRSRLIRRGFAPETGLISALAVPSPALSSSLVESTVKAAMLYAAGYAVEAGLVSGSAALLTQGVLRIMLISKLKVAAVALVIVGGVTTGAAVRAFQTRQNYGTAAASSDGRTTNSNNLLPLGLTQTDGLTRDKPKRLNDKEYKEWHDRLHEFHKKVRQLVDLAAAETDNDHLGQAAALTAQIETAVRDWHWFLDHPGAVSAVMTTSRSVYVTSDPSLPPPALPVPPPPPVATSTAPPEAPRPPSPPPAAGTSTTPEEPSVRLLPYGVLSRNVHSYERLPDVPATPLPPARPSADVARSTNANPPVVGDLTTPAPTQRLDELERKVDRILEMLERGQKRQPGNP